ncbi:unnamed protein product [Penicillium camemberti]|uniref:Str. FM013 n=1 Tax=Penicillium camemberti (strain FM 013) TaxID=1429867 RepID=A0A0G4P3L6_PENC3|nr:unnamed protein product [Penicillium camemberti]
MHVVRGMEYTCVGDMYMYSSPSTSTVPSEQTSPFQQPCSKPKLETQYVDSDRAELGWSLEGVLGGGCSRVHVHVHVHAESKKQDGRMLHRWALGMTN